MKSEELLYAMGTQAAVMRLSATLMRRSFDWRHSPVSRGNFENAVMRRRRARRRLGSLAARYLDAQREERIAREFGPNDGGAELPG